MKKCTLALLALVLAMSLAACGKDETQENLGGENTDGETFTCQGGHRIENEKSVALEQPDTALDPQQVYQNLTYVPEMFYGSYRAMNTNDDSGRKAFAQGKKTFEMEDGSRLLRYTQLPFEIKAGPENLNHVLSSIADKNIIQLYFMCASEEGEFNLTWEYCVYSLEGNKLLCTPVESWELDENKKVTSYTLGDRVLEYEFSFRGRELTLSAGGESVTLVSGLAVSEDEPYICVDNYLDLTTQGLEDLSAISFLHDHDREYPDHIIFTGQDGESFHGAAVEMEDNGRITFTIPREEGNKTYQLVYFYCGEDGLVLTDGQRVYYYTIGYFAHNKQLLADNVPQEDAALLEDLSQYQMEQAVEKKTDLLADLAAALEAEGIAVTVNAATGEIALDASVLFGGDSAQLSTQGKEMLNKFVKVYTQVVFSEKYEGFVSKTLVEGHTALLEDSTLESGMQLSQARADAVKAYCLSADTGVDTANLAQALEAVGLSNSKPVYDLDGNVDKAASRRVSFRVIIDLSQIG